MRSLRRRRLPKWSLEQLPSIPLRRDQCATMPESPLELTWNLWVRYHTSTCTRSPAVCSMRFYTTCVTDLLQCCLRKVSQDNPRSSINQTHSIFVRAALAGKDRPMRPGCRTLQHASSSADEGRFEATAWEERRHLGLRRCHYERHEIRR